MINVSVNLVGDRCPQTLYERAWHDFKSGYPPHRKRFPWPLGAKFEFQGGSACALADTRKHPTYPGVCVRILSVRQAGALLGLVPVSGTCVAIPHNHFHRDTMFVFTRVLERE